MSGYGGIVPFCLAVFVWSQIAHLTQAYTYIGCYKDDLDRDLPWSTLLRSDSMTLQHCNMHCKDSYAYFGVQGIYWCFCGNAYGEHGPAPESDCNHQCGGDSSQTCGGDWRNSIYRTGTANEETASGIVTPTDTTTVSGSTTTTDISTVSGSTTTTDISAVSGSTTTTDISAASDQAYPYIGCYKDTQDRDLSLTYSQSDVMTLQYCNMHCKDSYAYFGVQASFECFCGNAYGKHDSAPESECNYQCAGDGSQTCGGAYRNSIYRTEPYTYIGCYTDEINRDLKKAGTWNDSMTLQYCNMFCKDSYAYFGVQNGFHCFCGNGYGKYGEAPDECNIPCRGNSLQICGASYRNSIYRTEKSYEYFGCYIDMGNGNRDLDETTRLDHDSLTLEICDKHCRNSFKYFGVQFSIGCYCGNIFGKHGIASEKECDMACAGRSSEICGGVNRNSIYRTVDERENGVTTWDLYRDHTMRVESLRRIKATDDELKLTLRSLKKQLDGLKTDQNSPPNILKNDSNTDKYDTSKISAHST